MPRCVLARKADGTPTRKTQRNFTAADSHLMQTGGSYLRGYSGQLAVDSEHRNGSRCPEMPIPEPAWPASSQAGREQRSMPSARRSCCRRTKSGYRLTPAALSVAGPGEARRRMAADRCHAQPSEVVQTQAIRAAGAVGSHQMKGHGPGGVSQG